MRAYVLIHVEVLDPETYERYKPLAPPVIAAYGGRYLARGGKTAVLEGDWSPTRAVILEFPSVEKAKDWWASPEYAEARALRQASTRTHMIILEGL